MLERTVTIGSANGLHARPAATLVKTAAAQAAPVTITVGSGKSTIATSLLGILSLQVTGGAEVTLSAEGEGAEQSLATVAELLESNLDS